MKRFTCICGNRLFFANTVCVQCNRDVGWCPDCKEIASLDPSPDGVGFICTKPKCKAKLLKCDNYFTHNVCNRMVKPDPKAPRPQLCDYCRFNHTIPNLAVEGNKKRWGRVEAAKRLCLYDFDYLGFPYGTEADGVSPPLAFDFKSDSVHPDARYRDVAGGDQVFTGHDNGLITINLQEADPVLREKARVNFGEAHRTLVGHFRHEMGHYVWDVMIKDKPDAEAAFVDVFGDHTVSYADSMKAYYENGPRPDWLSNYVSGYATMHPWEDWAETFANYIDLMSSLETAEVGMLIPPQNRKKFDPLASTYVALGMTLNEMNRGIGLLDFLPELIAEPVRKKMAFVHAMTKFGK